MKGFDDCPCCKILEIEIERLRGELAKVLGAPLLKVGEAAINGGPVLQRTDDGRWLTVELHTRAPGEEI